MSRLRPKLELDTRPQPNKWQTHSFLVLKHGLKKINNSKQLVNNELLQRQARSRRTVFTLITVQYSKLLFSTGHNLVLCTCSLYLYSSRIPCGFAVNRLVSSPWYSTQVQCPYDFQYTNCAVLYFVVQCFQLLHMQYCTFLHECSNLEEVRTVGESMDTCGGKKSLLNPAWKSVFNAVLKKYNWCLTVHREYSSLNLSDLSI